MLNQGYIPRHAEQEILKLVAYFPVVAIVASRQVGKTSLAKAIQSQLDKPSIYLDMENPDDLVKLDHPNLF